METERVRVTTGNLTALSCVCSTVSIEALWCFTGGKEVTSLSPQCYLFCMHRDSGTWSGVVNVTKDIQIPHQLFQLNCTMLKKLLILVRKEWIEYIYLQNSRIAMSQHLACCRERLEENCLKWIIYICCPWGDLVTQSIFYILTFSLHFSP